MIGGGVRAGAARAQHPGQRLRGVVAVSQQRVMAEPFVIRLGPFLLRARRGERGIQPDADHPLDLLVRDRDAGNGAMAYRDARPCLPAGRVNGLVIRACARGPPAAISFSVRQTVGTEATGQRNPPRTAKSLITSAPSAITVARSASTRPRSWISIRGVARAFDRSAVRPVLSASDRIKTSPVCDTIPLPPEVTSRPRDHPVTAG